MYLFRVNVKMCYVPILYVMLQQMPPRREPVPELTTMDWICRFNKLNPPKFQGGTDPLKYEEWRRKLEKPV